MIFLKDTPLSLGGTNISDWYVVSGDSWADLHSFHRRWHGTMRPPAEGKKPEAIQLRLNVPDRGLEMHRSKKPVRVLVPGLWYSWLESLGHAWVPDKYIPVLNMILKKQYSAYSGRGLTPEMEKYFDQEIRGKVIDLLRSGQWVDDPEHSDLENLNQQLEKIDLGRRSDLKFSSIQSEDTIEVSEKYARQSTKEPRLFSSSSRIPSGDPVAEPDPGLTVGASGKSFRDFMGS